MMRWTSLLSVGAFFSELQPSLGHYSVGYQIHSNNDLEEWKQLLIKGATRFKVDLHYHEEGGNCAEKGFDSECFLLSHDNPNKEYISYNSSEDLVSFLTNDYPNLRRSEEDLVISFCFKSAPDKCDESSEEFSKWLRLVDDLYYTLVMNPPVGVEFVLDGDGKPENCLAGRWEEWDSVWIQGSSPDEAYYSNEGNNGRFQVLNDREGKMDWYKLAQDDYGKFTNSSSPYHLWEPDAQSDYQDYIRIYESGKEHQPGFCFAINTDIAMFNVYTTAVTDVSSVDSAVQQSSAINVKLVDEEDASRPQIVSLFQDADASVETFLYLYQSNNSDVMYSTLAIESLSSHSLHLSLQPRATKETTPLPNGRWLLDSDSAEIVGVSVSVTSTSKVLVTAASGKYCIYAASPASSELELEACNSFPVSGKTYDAVVIACEKAEPDAMCVLVLSGEEEDRKLLLTSFQVSLASSRRVGTHVTKSVSFRGNSPTFSRGRIALGENDIFIFASSQQGIMQQRIMAMSLPMAMLRTNEQTVIADSAWTFIGVGSHLAVSVGHGGVIMMVTDHGFCYNSHKHNTRSTEKVCSSIPKPSKHVLDYSIGLESDWAELLSKEGAETGATNSSLSMAPEYEHFVSPCHSRILHGSFDQGLRPAVSLSSLSSASYFLELHEGLSKTTFSNGGCGNPLHRGGLILDSFPIDQWVSNLKV